jgi:hypothetical protein
MAKGKIGPKSVGKSAKGTSPTGMVAGGPGKSFAQKPLAGPTGSGQPIAMRKALARKAGTGKGI